MILITDRDFHLLKWINALGFVEIDHITQKLGIVRRTAYIRLQKLIQLGFIRHDQILHRRPGAYRVTALGTQLTNDQLPPLKHISMTTYLHDLKVASLSLTLEEKYQAKFISERLIRHELGSKGVGQKNHVSDGGLILPDKRIAIEVELTTKGKHRLEKIYSHHLKNFDFNEVWYFCGSKSVYKLLKPWQEKNKIFRVHMLGDHLQEEGQNGG